MAKVYVNFDVSFFDTDYRNENFDFVYDNYFKKIASFLYAHNNFLFSLHLSGPFFAWLEKQHKEFIEILGELTSRKQIEIIGGGFYEPLFTFIPQSDRIGQIEKLTTEIRKATGKKVRGIKTVYSHWDNSLISSLKNCGIEYIMLDEELIPVKNPLNRPFIVEELGKTVTVFPVKKFNPETLYKNLNSALQNNNESLLFFTMSPKEFAENVDSQFFEKLFQSDLLNTKIELSTPTKCQKNISPCIKCNIPSSASSEVLKYALEPFVEKNKVTCDIKQFLYTYPVAYSLYCRMIYACMINDQCRGDKIRKMNSRELIWEAQNNLPYLYKGINATPDKKIREGLYKNLIKAEKITREVLPVQENSYAIDENNDGINEYIFKFLNYNAFIQLTGGCIFELDIFANNWNYSSAIRRNSLFDPLTDLYDKKLFMDHFFTNDKINEFSKEASLNNNCLGNLLYSVTGFDRSRNELFLQAHTLLTESKQSIFIRKKYLFTANGIQIQYIIQNASSEPVKTTFAIESNITFIDNSNDNLITDIILNDSKKTIKAQESFFKKDQISYIQFTEEKDNITFIFQPNENCGFALNPLYITRPQNGNITKEYQAHNAVIFWNLNIAPGMEIEKNLSMSIKTPELNCSKKSKKKK